MIDPRTIELINKEVDGLLSPSESERLQKQLSGDTDATSLHRDMIALAKMLSRVEAVEPHPNLKKHILNSIPANKYSTKSRLEILGVIRRQLNFKLAFSFAVGLFIGMLTYSFVSTNDSLKNKDALFGTIFLNQTDAETFKVVGEVDLNANNLEGTLVTESSGDVVLLKVVLSQLGEVAIGVEFDEQDIGFSGFRSANYSGGQFNINTNRLRFTMNGPSEVTLIFRNKTSRDSNFKIKMTSGNTTHEETLRTTVAKGGKVRR